MHEAASVRFKSDIAWRFEIAQIIFFNHVFTHLFEKFQFKNLEILFFWHPTN